MKVSIQSDFDGRGVRQAERSLHSLHGTTNKVGGGISALGATAGVAAATGFAALAIEGRRAFDAFDESRKISAQTNAVIKATGGAAGVTAGEVGKLSSALSRKTGVDDEAIQTGANLLLTFKNVHNEAGRGSDVFNRATRAAVDLSKAGFGSIDSASKQLGKALNDPIKGTTALARAGVTFTQQQKDQIATLVESNRTLEAQKIIMREVESQVGGSAAAQATSLDRLKVSFGNVEEAVGQGLAPAVDSVAGKLDKLAVKAEPILRRTGKEIGAIFDSKSLSLDDKFKLSGAALNRNLIRPLERAAERAHLGEKLGDAVEDALPKVMEAAGHAGTKATAAFLKGWWNADGWGKLATVGFLMAKLGGFSAAGSLAAGRFSSTFGDRLKKDKGLTQSGAVAGGAWGKAFGVAGATVALAIIAKAASDFADEQGVSGKKSGGGFGSTGSGSGGPNSFSRFGIGLANKLFGPDAVSGSVSSVSAAGMGLGGAAGRAATRVGKLDHRSGYGAAFPGASGTGVHGGVRQLANATAGVYGGDVTVGTGKVGHSKYTTSGNVSEHYSGDAVDIPAQGTALIRMGQSALIAAGADPKWARRQSGGLFNISTPGGGRAQIIFNTQEGGDHTDHLHIGLKGSLGKTRGATTFGGLQSAAKGAAGPRFGLAGRSIGQVVRDVPQLAKLNRTFAETHVGKGGARLNPTQVRMIAEAVGFNPTDALHMSQIAKGESSMFPGMVQNDPGDGMVGYGLLQMTPGNVRANWGAAALKHFEKLGGRKAMLNPVTNLRMAKYLFDRGGLGHWMGTAFLKPGSKAARSVLPGPRGGSVSTAGSIDWGDFDRELAGVAMGPALARLRGRLAGPSRTLGLTAGRLDTLDNKLGLSQRRAGLTDEDLTTASGRSARSVELWDAANLTRGKLGAQSRQRSALQQRASALERAISSLKGLLKRVPASARGTIRGQIRAKAAQLKDARDEARTLGWDIKTTRLDLAEIYDESQDVAATRPEEDGTVTAPDQDAAYDLFFGPINRDVALAQLNGNKVEARRLLAAKQTLLRDTFLPAALKTPGLDDDMKIIAALEETNGALKALDETVQEATAVTQAQLDATKEQLAETRRRLNTSEAQGRAMVGVLADLVSGEIGGRAGLASSSVSAAGMVARL